MNTKQIMEFINKITHKAPISLFVNVVNKDELATCKDRIIAIISAAKTKNIDIYIRTFGQALEETQQKFQITDMTPEEIWGKFYAGQHVFGKANIENVWNFCNEQERKAWILSIIMTDFNLDINKEPEQIPVNGYYISTKSGYTKEIAENMTSFITKMYTYGYDLRGHIPEYVDP